MAVDDRVEVPRLALAQDDVDRSDAEDGRSGRCRSPTRADRAASPRAPGASPCRGPRTGRKPGVIVPPTSSSTAAPSPARTHASTAAASVTVSAVVDRFGALDERRQQLGPVAVAAGARRIGSVDEERSAGGRSSPRGRAPPGSTSLWTRNSSRASQASRASSSAVAAPSSGSPSVTTSTDQPISGRSIHGCVSKIETARTPGRRSISRDASISAEVRQLGRVLALGRGQHPELAVGRDRPDLAAHRRQQDVHPERRRLVVVDVGLGLEADQRTRRARHPGRAVDVGVERGDDREVRPDDLAERRQQVALGIVLLGRHRRPVDRQHDPGQPVAVCARPPRR